MIETDRWPLVKARWFTDVPKSAPRTVRVIVMHTMEAPEKGTTAENVARYFATTNTKASAHVCVDNDSVIQCVPDSDVAYAAPGCNNDGIQVEMAGYARQDRDEWYDRYSLAVLANSAKVAAQYCLKYDIPPVRLTDQQLQDGQRGIVGHDQASRVYKRSTHSDPGESFPWTFFIGLVKDYASARRALFTLAKGAPMNTDNGRNGYSDDDIKDISTGKTVLRGDETSADGDTYGYWKKARDVLMQDIATALSVGNDPLTVSFTFPSGRVVTPRDLDAVNAEKWALLFSRLSEWNTDQVIAGLSAKIPAPPKGEGEGV